MARGSGAEAAREEDQEDDEEEDAEVGVGPMVSGLHRAELQRDRTAIFGLHRGGSVGGGQQPSSQPPWRRPVPLLRPTTGDGEEEGGGVPLAPL